MPSLDLRPYFDFVLGASGGRYKETTLIGGVRSDRPVNDVINARRRKIGYAFMVYKDPKPHSEIRAARRDTRPEMADQREEARKALSREELYANQDQALHMGVLFEHMDNHGDKDLPARKTPRLARGHVAVPLIEPDTGSFICIVRPFDDEPGASLCRDIELLGFQQCSLYHERYDETILFLELSVVRRGMRPRTELLGVVEFFDEMTQKSYPYVYQGMLRNITMVRASSAFPNDIDNDPKYALTLPKNSDLLSHPKEEVMSAPASTATASQASAATAQATAASSPALADPSVGVPASGSSTTASAGANQAKTDADQLQEVDLGSTADKTVAAIEQAVMQIAGALPADNPTSAAVQASLANAAKQLVDGVKAHASTNNAKIQDMEKRNKELVARVEASEREAQQARDTASWAVDETIDRLSVAASARGATGAAEDSKRLKDDLRKVGREAIGVQASLANFLNKIYTAIPSASSAAKQTESSAPVGVQASGASATAGVAASGAGVESTKNPNSEFKAMMGSLRDSLKTIGVGVQASASTQQPPSAASAPVNQAEASSSGARAQNPFFSMASSFAGTSRKDLAAEMNGGR